MARRLGGLRIALPAALLLATQAAACTPTLPPATSPRATPSTSVRPPTPVPTAAQSVGPTEPPAPAELIVRLTSCSHTCGPEAGTTMYTDGRAIWQDRLGRPITARLTPVALRRVEHELSSSGVLDAPADFHAELRPGASPIGHGTTLLRFERLTGGQPVVVTSGDPGDYADQPRAWIFPPQMTLLAGLAAQLRDPVAWLGEDGFRGPPAPYVPDHYLLEVDLYPDVGEQPGLVVDVDEVAWPFEAPIEEVGEPADPEGGGLGTRCLILDRPTAIATADAERAAGGLRDLRQWTFTVEYGWSRSRGFVAVSTTALLPHQTGPCAELTSAFP